MHHEMCRNPVENLVYSIKDSLPIKKQKVTKNGGEKLPRRDKEGMAVSTTKSGSIGGFWTVVDGPRKSTDGGVLAATSSTWVETYEGGDVGSSVSCSIYKRVLGKFCNFWKFVGDEILFRCRVFKN